jgi:uncharacterized protein YbjT (DUF2867 family)
MGVVVHSCIDHVLLMQTTTHLVPTRSTDNAPVLVLGSTGKTGRRVAARLAALGRAVRPGSRGARLPFDWDKPATWPDALRGIRAAYVSYQPDIAAPGAAETMTAFVGAARDAGVRRLVLLSGRGEPGTHPAEDAVRTSGLEHTVLRCAWFAQNFDEGHLADDIRRGVLAFPAGDVQEPFVDLDDVAELAVAALVTDRHLGATYELTGPRLLGFAEAVETIAKAAGRAIRYEPVSKAAYAVALAAVFPPEVATYLSELFAEVLDGHNAFVTPDLERALGRAPRDFATYARDAAARGVFG